MKKDFYKTGQLIRIIVPESVIRVGYPKSIFDEDIKEKVGGCNTKISEFLVKTEMPWQVYGVIDVIERKIKSALAYGFLYKKGFGGKERSIHTRSEPLMLGLIGKIVKKRIVRTGFREKEIVDWFDDEWSETRYFLDKIKTHTLLLISLYKKNGDRKERCRTVWIEDKNIEFFKE